MRYNIKEIAKFTIGRRGKEAWFLDLYRLTNRKRERFKIFKIKP